MREKCFEIGTIQAFLDGELASAVSENVARHVAVCSDCAVLMAEAEEESAFAFAALESELNTLVPTQRLWSKINQSHTACLPFVPARLAVGLEQWKCSTSQKRMFRPK